MHPEADALLDAIFDNPDDDTPRLVYADWLQENGQEDYAQFIRLSVQAENGSKLPAERKRLGSERKALWKRMVAVRHDAVRHTPIALHNYERGLCNAVTIHGDTFLRTVESWWPAITPRELTVYGMRGFGTRSIEAEIVAAVGRHLPWLRVLHCLNRQDRHVHDIYGYFVTPLGGSVFAALAAPGLLPRLRSLKVSITSADIPALCAFAESELVARLETFHAEVHLPETDNYEDIIAERKQRPDAIRLALVAFLAGRR
jgi:uncharacterized protein (TIGR02996 family)